MVSVEKAIVVWQNINSSAVQVDNLNGGISKITDFSDGEEPKIATDNLGNAIAVWKKMISGKYVLQASYYNKSENKWLETKDFSNPNYTASDYQITMVDSDNSFVVWLETNTSGRADIFVSSYIKGTNAWTTQKLISTAETVNSVPQIAMDSSGNALSIWLSTVNAFDIVQVSYYTKGGDWSVPFTLSLTTATATSPKIAMDSDGNAIALWALVVGSAQYVQAKTYTKGTGWSGITKDLSDIDKVSTTPQISMNSLGNAVAVWSISNTSDDIIQALYYTKVSGWSTSVKNLSASGKVSIGPQISMDSLGNASSLWLTNIDSKSVVYASYYNKTTDTWVLNSNPLSNTANDAENPKIKMTSSGNAIAVWKINDAADGIIQAKYYTKGSGWSTTTLNLSPVGNTSVYPELAIDNYVEPTTATTTVIIIIDANYNSLITNAATLATFETAVAVGVSGATGVDENSVTVDKATSGSIITELTMPTEFILAFETAILNGSFYIVINGVIYRAFREFIIVDNICFQRGTTILTPNGYRTVESLKKGDTVSTAQGGIVKIQKVTSFVGKKEKCPLYVLNKDSLAPNMPLMDLYMSEGHAYRHNGKWSHMKCSSLAMEVDVDDIQYYNIAVDNYIKNTLIANGVEVESLFNMNGLKMRWNCKTDNCKPIIEIEN